MSKYAIFHIEGGIGKHIAATAVIEAYKKQNPDDKVIVTCAWTQVFERNDNIYKVFRHGETPYFYSDYILDKDSVIFAHDPYKETKHINQETHLIETWCKMVGVEYDGEKPTLSYNLREGELASKVIANDIGKPILLFQPFGGPGKNHQQFPYSWTRDIHPSVAQTLVNILSHKYTVVHVCYDFHPQLINCVRIDQELSKGVLFALLEQADERLLIDSSLQHAAAAMGLRSTVVWVATSPSIFGYDLHRNVEPSKKFRQGTRGSYLYDYNLVGVPEECPYSTTQEIHELKDIIGDLI